MGDDLPAGVHERLAVRRGQLRICYELGGTSPDDVGRRLEARLQLADGELVGFTVLEDRFVAPVVAGCMEEKLRRGGFFPGVSGEVGFLAEVAPP